ncbi:MAG: radical SAM protein [Bacteroidetes bacterium]|nr:radical SAM protein [Bacteroidota bacterium]
MRKRFACSYDRIELVITYACNLACNNCDAMVPQAVSGDRMTVEQIEKFIEESIEKKVHWKHIRVLGGEPTLHKDIFIFLDLLINYKNKYSPNTRIILVTNGHGKVVNKRISQVPKEVEIENSNKTSSIQPSFSPINEAPIDIVEHKKKDFSKGCWIPSLCGITLDMHGYYPCSTAASIDRVFGFNMGKKMLPTKLGELERLFPKACSLCGHFVEKANDLAKEDVITKDQVEKFEKIHKEKFAETVKDNELYEQVTSPTWKKALGRYKLRKPVLNRY